MARTEHVHSPSMAVRPSLEKQHLCESSAELVSLAPSPAARHKGRRDAGLHPIAFHSREKVGRGRCAPTPPGETRPRLLGWFWGPAWMSGTPKNRGLGLTNGPDSHAWSGSGNPPRARRPLTARARPRRRARERGPLRLPHALGAQCDGATECRALAGRADSGRHRVPALGGSAPPPQRSLRHARSPRKVWRSEGRCPRRPRPGPAFHLARLRAPPPRHGFGAQSPLCRCSPPGRVPCRAAGLEEEMAPTKGPRAATGLTEPYLRALY